MKNKLLKLFRCRETILAIIIVILVIVISSINSDFLSYENITNVLKSYTILGVFSLGVLVVIVSGGIDVSFTAIAQVAQYVVVFLLVRYIPNGNIYLAFIMAIFVGVTLGLFNGFLIYHYKMPAIIITIATQSLFYGLLYVITRGQLLYEIPSYFWVLSDAKVFPVLNANGIPVGISIITIIWFFMAVLLFLLLRYTMLGRNIYLIGGNSVAAERVGINIFRTTLFIYAFIERWLRQPLCCMYLSYKL